MSLRVQASLNASTAKLNSATDTTTVEIIQMKKIVTTWFVAKTISSATITAVIRNGIAATAILTAKIKKMRKIAAMAHVERMSFSASSVNGAFQQHIFVTAGLLVPINQMKVTVNVRNYTTFCFSLNFTESCIIN